MEGRAIWYHEFEDTNQQVTAAFGGARTSTLRARASGATRQPSVSACSPTRKTGVSFQLNYDALLRQDFIGHTGSGRVKVEF